MELGQSIHSLIFQSRLVALAGGGNGRLRFIINSKEVGVRACVCVHACGEV